MNEKTTPTRAQPGAGAPAAEAAAVLADMRSRLDEATNDVERLTAELEQRTQALDEFEGLVDVLLGVSTEAVVVVQPDRRVRALSRAAAEMLGLDASHVGKALASVVPDEIVVATREQLLRLSEGTEVEAGDDEVVAGSWTVTVTGLADGGAVLVLHEK
jgi:PAS domain-containing protein